MRATSATRSQRHQAVVHERPACKTRMLKINELPYAPILAATRAFSRLVPVDEMVARHGGKGTQPHDQGRPESGRCRQGLGHEPPDDVPWLKVVRDHDELVRANQPMQLIDLRVNTWLAGQVRPY